jgi:hypothetical protein
LKKTSVEFKDTDTRRFSIRVTPELLTLRGTAFQTNWPYASKPSLNMKKDVAIARHLKKFSTGEGRAASKQRTSTREIIYAGWIKLPKQLSSVSSEK